MSILSRTLAGTLLAAALVVTLHGLAGPRARGEEFIRLCGPEVFPLGSNIQWDPYAYGKFSEVFVIEGTRYRPEERRFTLALRSRNSFPGSLAKAEEELFEAMMKATKGGLFAAYYYDAEGRKMGRGELFFTFSERRPDNTFTVYADLNLQNADLIATKGIITLIEQRGLLGRKLEFKVEPPGVDLMPGGKAKLKVTATKRGFPTLPIRLELKGLPKGVTAGKAEIVGINNYAEVELTAAEDAEAVMEKGVYVEGISADPGVPLRGRSSPFTVTVRKKE
jgi:hypothetical protein